MLFKMGKARYLGHLHVHRAMSEAWPSRPWMYVLIYVLNAFEEYLLVSNSFSWSADISYDWRMVHVVSTEWSREFFILTGGGGRQDGCPASPILVLVNFPNLAAHSPSAGQQQQQAEQADRGEGEMEISLAIDKKDDPNQIGQDNNMSMSVYLSICYPVSTSLLRPSFASLNLNLLGTLSLQSNRPGMGWLMH